MKNENNVKRLSNCRENRRCKSNDAKYLVEALLFDKILI